MSVMAHFAREPAAARAHFLRACGRIGLAVRQHRLAAAGGGTADIIAARLGSPEARLLLVLTPGAKPGDALCAAGIQAGCLREPIRRAVPRSVAMVFLHADQPGRILAPDAAHAPDDHVRPMPNWSDSVLAAAESRYAAYQRGRTALALVPRPASADPAAAAAQPEWAAGFAALAATELAGAKQVAIVDIATGSGEYGRCDVVAGHSPGSPGEMRARALFGAQPLAAGSAAGSMPGPLARGLASALGDAEATVAAMAFGTYSVRAVVHSMLGAGASGPASGSGLFYPDADDWKEAVWHGAAGVIHSALAGLDGA